MTVDDPNFSFGLPSFLPAKSTDIFYENKVKTAKQIKEQMSDFLKIKTPLNVGPGFSSNFTN